MSHEIYCEDNATRLADLKDKSIGAALFDPPYGLGENRDRVMSRGRGGFLKKNRSSALALPTDYGEFDWDDKPADPATIAHIRRATHKQVIWGGNYYDLPPTSCWLIWDKVNGEIDFADAELAWTNLKSAVRIFHHQWSGFLRETEREKRVHPSQKPVALMRWCLEQMKLEPGCTILDPYMGSGSVGIAAVQMGFHYIGIERVEDYFATAKQRIEDAERMTRRQFKAAKVGKPNETNALPLFAEVA